ncbi:hypothetical protein M427DRAFT_32449 [Gonapodya prolifera JEL478]|uniref:L domain-like protein n=1 Tax=Gonapodya prolifera (strain JEL478) TaxID=1344416 RepID=A0A139AEL8_GONPJ|nr:hypothetical protein M427DRAFT_32449 [Gonapodya prolifera JEL478]|eukprot:KXS15217.1 hypothetical protein M427DRAFT_32449 [Gonapodya prolifera JEL478]
MSFVLRLAINELLRWAVGSLHQPSFAVFSVFAGVLLLLPNGIRASNGLTAIPPQELADAFLFTSVVVWYGANWTPNNKAIITDFITGFDKSDVWKVATKYYNIDKTGTSPKKFVSSTLKHNGQTDEPSYSMGKFLNFRTSKNYNDLLTFDHVSDVQAHIQVDRLPTDQTVIYLVLTDDQTLEAGFMRGYCSKVGSTAASKIAAKQDNANRISSRAPDVRWVYAGTPKATSKDGTMGCTSHKIDVSPNGNPDVDIIIERIANGILNFAVSPPTTGTPLLMVKGLFSTSNGTDGSTWLSASLQQILSDQTYFGDDCCNSGCASCANGRIIGLDLSYFCLSDTPQPVIDTLSTAFPNLRTLDLSKKDLAASPVPASLCQLQKLELLWMGNFPTAPTSLLDCFGSMPNLRGSGRGGFCGVSTGKAGGHAGGVQSLTKLSNLRQVLLDGNDFTGNVFQVAKIGRIHCFSAAEYKAFDKPLLNADGTYDGSCDLSGTKVCVSAGGPDCKIEKC